ncbi:MAG TPA: T4 RnlA family RNA ligase [Planktothrix sp.]|jgi:hypothetical protein
MKTKNAVQNLRQFVGALVEAGVNDWTTWKAWRDNAENAERMRKWFGYEQGLGMPSITNLVKPFFHPTLPLIGLNYSEIAQFTLHAFENGWTPTLCLCRGIIFDRDVNLVAFPFPKFFNFGEEKQITKPLPGGKFVVRRKYDGHLLITFKYQGEIVGTTRGSFISHTSKVADKMLDVFRQKWATSMPDDVTVLLEVIHPTTHVIVDYDKEGFILLGAFDRNTFHDFSDKELVALSKKLGVKLAEEFKVESLEVLDSYVRKSRYLNQEGFVVRFDDGERVKYKFKSYISRWIGAKLSVGYVMNSLINGTYESKFADLSADVRGKAERIRKQIVKAATCSANIKEQRARLYGLVPGDECNSTHKQKCGKILKLVREKQLKAA